MITWHKPDEKPEEEQTLLMLYDDGSPSMTIGDYMNGQFTSYLGGGELEVLAWTEYNMPEWVERKQDEQE